MIPARIAMRPVDDASLRIPFVLTIEDDGIALSQGTDSRSKIDVMRHQQGLPGIQSNNEPLMPAAVGVVRQHLPYRPFALDFKIADSILKGSCQDRVAAAARS